MLDKDPLTNEDALRWRCFDATYASRLLTDGYGFQDQEAAVEFLGEIDGVEVEWTLGALLDSILKHKGGGSSGGGEPSSGDGDAPIPMYKVVVVVAIYLLRTGLMNCTYPLEDSVRRREQAAEMRKAGAMGVTSDGRPNKKQRRQIHQLHGSFE